ncbi:threonine/serine exporter family protein [Aquiflexum sp. LQ15W]|uniref:threonine/serine exporter family protein n=1 Tax=Cognataquiflexum nitidum TaxID=2922272 RepID=UPI001F133FDF|nr:threonine/serine exporter family protein [Cognataquiflexum nitidum]MCH6199527.1 threonine/serine exporter family protein [Cognataquiflexum nitidum]
MDIVFKAFWCGCAAVGFAILFNSPARALFAVFLCGSLAGFLKFSVLLPGVGGGIIMASAAGAAAVGFASIPVSHWRHVPPIVISIPSVIPLIPGSFAYRTILGLISFVSNTEMEVLTKTAHHGVMTFFIILALSLGVTLPMLLFRIESVKKVNYSLPDWWKKK